jgi:hypothetical protein
LYALVEARLVDPLGTARIPRIDIFQLPTQLPATVGRQLADALVQVAGKLQYRLFLSPRQFAVDRSFATLAASSSNHHWTTVHEHCRVADFPFEF